MDDCGGGGDRRVRFETRPGVNNERLWYRPQARVR